MRLHRLFLGVSAFVCVLGVAYITQTSDADAPGVTMSQMTQAAEKLIDTLPPEQKARATYTFEDKERINFQFVPKQDKDRKPTRKGVRLEEMSKESREAALALLKTGTSERGYKSATAIMSLESVLHQQETGGRSVRNPDWYFFTVFGKPSKNSKWGWRVEGHHLSLNFTLDGDRVIAATPAFFGANPATIKNGPRKGEKTLTEEDDLARKLFLALDGKQQKAALQSKQFPETPAGQSDPSPGAAKGVTAGAMSEGQRAILMKLIETYTGRMNAEIAAMEMKHMKAAGLEKVYFAYAGSAEEAKPHSYRIQGPTIVIEFLNVQADGARNPANHIHSSTRRIKGDFGLKVD